MNASPPDFSDVDAAFGRYCRRSDPKDLAFVFDRVAARLLLVAAHITPDPGTAEDLLQETFVHALESSESFEVGRPVLPWLTTILRRRAIDRLRREGYRQGETLGADRFATADSSPLQDAADAELLEKVERALADLASPYREALALRIVHGLSPTEIAHALDRKPGTVRMQLKRGLEELRGKLSLALSSALVFALLPERGLAAVRAQVMDAATRVAGPTALFGLTRSAWLLTGGVLVVLAALPLLWTSFTNVAPVADLDPEASGSPPVAQRLEKAANDKFGNSVAERMAVIADLQVSRFSGRCLSSISSEPLVGADVLLSFSAGRFVDDEARRWPVPVRVSTADDGRFVIEFVPQREMRVSLRISAPGHASTSAEWVSLRSGFDVDLGDIRLPLGGRIKARVIDPNGVPLAGVPIELNRQGGGDDERPDSSFFRPSSYELTSSPSGDLILEEPLIAGTYLVALAFSPSRYQLGQPRPIVIEAGSTTAGIDIVARPIDTARSLSGRVVNEGGRPVPGLSLSVDEKLFGPWATVTGDDGRFWFPEIWMKELQLYLHPDERRYTLLFPSQTYKQGDTGLTIRVSTQPLRDLEIRVTDARTGRPVDHYGLAWSVDYWLPERELMVPPMGAYRSVPPQVHARGVTRLSDVAPGRYRLSVFSGDGSLAPRRLVPILIAAEGASVIEVELYPYAPLSVRVLDAEGKSVAGAEVRLIHGLASEGKWSSCFTLAQVERGVGAGLRMSMVLDTETSDALGRVQFNAPPDDARLYLDLSPKGVLAKRTGPHRIAIDGSELELETEITARVTGRLGPVELLSLCGPDASDRLAATIERPEDTERYIDRLRLYLEPLSEGRGVFCRSRVKFDGFFEFAAVPAGDYRVKLMVSWPMKLGFDTSDDDPLGQVLDLRRGESRHLDLKASFLMPGTMSGHVSLDGVAWADGRVGLLAVEDAEARPFMVDIGGEGRYRLAVRAGLYLPFIAWRATGDNTEVEASYVHSSEPIALRAGASMDLDLSFVKQQLELRFEDLGAVPGIDSVWVTALGFPGLRTWGSRSCAMDADGRVLLSPAPPGSLRVSVGGNLATARALEVVECEPGTVLTRRVLSLSALRK